MRIDGVVVGVGFRVARVVGLGAGSSNVDVGPLSAAPRSLVVEAGS